MVTEPENAGDGLAVMNAATHHHADGRAKREEFDLDYLVLLRLRRPRAQSPRQVNGHGLGNKAGTRIEVQDSLPTRCCVARFLKQFAFGRRHC